MWHLRKTGAHTWETCLRDFIRDAWHQVTAFTMARNTIVAQDTPLLGVALCIERPTNVTAELATLWSLTQSWRKTPHFLYSLRAALCIERPTNVTTDLATLWSATQSWRKTPHFLDSLRAALCIERPTNVTADLATFTVIKLNRS